ncbi:hypothetical protein J21TS7_62170 [Paenibacillus cineris]|uniref:Uncharacterized protein n=1 Tax=Paenibacillus cineris TaxID=237530 RepID=A0ABQ4LN23_9BACL|nr:hypothetical protein J21TS7_62170 [Paenibacillus cineris]
MVVKSSLPADLSTYQHIVWKLYGMEVDHNQEPATAVTVARRAAEFMVGIF